MGNEFENVELFSFHSTSKGLIGECGRRGGYVECVGIDQAVIDQLYKFCTVNLCPNIQGQVMLDLLVNPPKKGDYSYDFYAAEMQAIQDSLSRRAKMLVEGFRKLEGVTCNDAQGAMYVFPRIRLPEKFLEQAKKAGKKADALYCMELLNATGVCLVPGSGFGQEEDTLHFRSTFLPPENEFQSFIGKISKFHAEFMDKYRK